MSVFTPEEITELAANSGRKKAHLSLLPMLILGFFGGAFIALGYLLDIHVIGTMPKAWGSFTSFLGAAVFPIGLILVILAGGELVTGNMMTVSMAWLHKKIDLFHFIRNLFIVTFSNFIGAVFVAYFFGHIVGLAEGAFLAKTVSVAQAKLQDTPLQAFISAIGCNWLVCLAVWLSMGSKEFIGKIIGIWFPVMTFVAIGFQHVVANMFVIPAAIFAGHLTWIEYFPNFIFVFFGNLVGGMLFVALPYFISYKKKLPSKEEQTALKKKSVSA
ncbi:TPA: formate/nitrite transporter family protein [Bacillus anthracis]|uniref:Formate transporter n=1 Tax=Bacillus thuringiensis subsp. konkukian (strain 97-27) TaxID=281309 RepID=Q6HF84_BACHK|nr:MULTISPECIES: formate/nitrite transporter family protein [Bacillus cereus group]MDR4320323.1 formate/nitrite transporter family protein [Bacillus paranthracis]HDR4494841.1 formate/nitrite transporter family protein [Bacillus cereus biovar anthracis]AAT60547.1 formate transporter [[Bacillus thuringiensis] serovar konkukian str. 97-27]ADK06290.1 formate/nitrite transporter [Bacillus cereus biovar anthracis str. CI]AJI32949.1 formate/nitrite transporter family protein [Bacillus thuringiensis]